MRKTNVLIFSLIIVLGFILFAYNFLGFRTSIKDGESLDFVDLPNNFKIEEYYTGLSDNSLSPPGPNRGPRLMLLKDGVLYVTISKQGKVIAIQDVDNDQKGDGSTTILENLDRPHGIDYHNGWFYIAEEGQIFRVREAYGVSVDTDTKEILVDDIPEGGHFTRTLKIHNNSLYFTVGSSCNVCYEDHEWRASMVRCNLSGSNCSVFASGLRNAVGFVFHPETDEIYATDNGRDLLGENIPPDEINLIKEGEDYGWPICYGNNIHDSSFDKNQYVRDPCLDKEPSLVSLQAHSAPLGLTIYNGNQFPEEYRGDIFVAYHGSWNREDPTGYKVARIDLETKEVIDFASGWLQEDGNVLGRPVDVIVSEDGSLLVSDDNSGKIYRIYYD